MKGNIQGNIKGNMKRKYKRKLCQSMHICFVISVLSTWRKKSEPTIRSSLNQTGSKLGSDFWFRFLNKPLNESVFLGGPGRKIDRGRSKRRAKTPPKKAKKRLWSLQGNLQGNIKGIIQGASFCFCYYFFLHCPPRPQFQCCFAVDLGIANRSAYF